MATVTNTVKLPDGSTPGRVDVVIELVASTTGRAAGWITATDVTLEATVRPTVTNGAWTTSLTPNADITPSGSVYKVTEYVDKTRYTHYIEVDADGGSVLDLLVDPPASVASAALTSHINDATDVHDASAIGVLDAAGDYAGSDVESVLAEIADNLDVHNADLDSHYAALVWRPSSAPMLFPVASSESPTVGAVATSSAIGSAKQWRAVSPSVAATGTALALPAHFTDRQGNGAWEKYGIGYPDYNYVKVKNVTDPVIGGGYQGGYSVEFETDALQIEFLVKGLAASAWVWIDDRPLSGRAVTWAISSTGSINYLPLTFGARTRRRIRFESTGTVFGGVYTDATATVQATSNFRPKAVVLGDSFTESGAATVGVLSGFARTLGELLGWDVMPSGNGGTGYLNPGTGGRVKFRDRVAYDVIAKNPDIVVVAGGINDYASYSSAAIGAEATALFAAIAAGLPSARLVVSAPFWRNGVETIPYTLLDAKDAIYAAATAMDALWVDPIEIPLRAGQSLSSTLSSATLVNATSFASSADFPIGCTVEIGTSTARERRVVTALSGVGPFTHTVAALNSAHSSGEVVRLVGPCLWTGTGKVGSTTGSGNSDRLVSSDGTHPTQDGYDALASCLAAQICNNW